MDDPVFIESRVEMEQLLRQEVVGYLGVAGDEGPYVVPLNYAYTAGKIVFHCALTGQKLDAICRDPRVCFTVGRQTGAVRDHEGGPPCHVDSDSVVCYGRARLLDDLDERAAALNTFNRRYRPDAPDLAPERIAQCMAFEVTITEMTGRREQNRQRTFWRARF
jgi:nitroimidazol reductase NimA-like FMN-containing flavoprotein (pyridoxamine 5'-phosphate oxidase superfamily)